MPNYSSPGVYIEEISSGSAPIVGVGTSIAAFIGTIKSSNQTATNSTPFSDTKDEKPKNKKEEGTNGQNKFTYNINIKVLEEKVGIGDGKKITFDLKNYPVVPTGFKVKVNGTEQTVGVTLNNDHSAKKSQLKFETAPISESIITVDYDKSSVPAGEIKHCTNFSEFKNFFGDFLPSSGDTKGQNILAHAVQGFFQNGGKSCYVTWINENQNSGTEESGISDVLDAFEVSDDINIVAAPGNLDLRDKIKDHCEKMGDRIAILDSEESIDLSNPENFNKLKPFDSTYAALYFPWIQVYDPASKNKIYIPPCGHIAGIYSRVDGQRGVYKAPANETISGALSLKYSFSKAQQDKLNSDGINCIRELNGNIRVWGARTLGGDTNQEFKYVNVRRYFSYLRDSIDKGTQWAVFEPNNPALWQKIKRNVSDFLLVQWRSGALFGNTPQEAFYVQCDEETNPPEERALGRVITKVGVSIVRPAEFVIFQISQFSLPS